MTLLVRDEADIVEACVRYHLEHCVDFVVVTDHGSVDRTSEILSEFERGGAVRVLRESAEIRQAEWTTRMARMAATEHGADWVVNVDADEFWLPRNGSLREILAAVPPRFGVVRALQRHFAPRPEASAPFHARMVARLPSNPDPRALNHAQVKVLHRASGDVVVPRGNHDAYGPGLRLLRNWFPIEVLHFPVRTPEQMARKYSRRTDSRAPVARAMAAAIQERGVEQVFEELVVDDDRLVRDVAAGVLAVDLRVHRALTGGSDLPAALPRGVAPETAVQAESAYVADIGAFMTTDAREREERRIRDLVGRVGTLERYAKRK